MGDNVHGHATTPGSHDNPPVRKAHPGFKAVQAKIAAREGGSSERAGAILAASTRRAGAAARKANPRLNRVK